MNLIPAIGMRTRYTWKEVASFLGMGDRLRKRYAGQYPFDQSDVNQFITRLNAGQINPGCCGFASKNSGANYIKKNPVSKTA